MVSEVVNEQMDKKLFMSKMVLHDDNFRKLAKAMNTTYERLVRMIQRNTFTNGYIAFLADRWDLTDDEIIAIFALRKNRKGC